MGRSIYSEQHRHLTAVLRAARKETGVTQIGLSEALGKPQSYVSKYESGQRRLDLTELEAICDVIGIGLDELVRRYLDR